MKATRRERLNVGILAANRVLFLGHLPRPGGRPHRPPAAHARDHEEPGVALLAGVASLAGSVAAAVTGQTMAHFWIALVLLGVG